MSNPLPCTKLPIRILVDQNYIIWIITFSKLIFFKPFKLIWSIREGRNFFTWGIGVGYHDIGFELFCCRNILTIVRLFTHVIFRKATFPVKSSTTSITSAKNCKVQNPELLQKLLLSLWKQKYQNQLRSRGRIRQFA